METKKKVTVGFALPGGGVHTLKMTPPAARAMALTIYDEADFVEGRGFRADRIKSRWRVGGERDRLAFGIGWALGALLYASEIRNWWMISGLLVLGLGMAGYRAFRDAGDELTESRERVHGRAVDDETGQLPWEVLS